MKLLNDLTLPRPLETKETGEEASRAKNGWKNVRKKACSKRKRSKFPNGGKKTPPLEDPDNVKGGALGKRC